MNDIISFDDFKKVVLRVAEVVSAERVEGSEKLLKLSLSLGEEKRQVLAGIGKRYEPETLIGKRVVLVANLAPRTMMGEESQGMLLAGDGVDGPALLMPDGEVLPGAEVR